MSRELTIVIALMGLFARSPLHAETWNDLKGPRGPVDPNKLEEWIKAAKTKEHADALNEIKKVVSAGRPLWTKQEEKLTFPCLKEIREAKVLPKLFLHGEKHRGDPESEKARKLITDEAINDKCFLGQEGDFYCPIEKLPPAKFRISYGIDTPFTHGITGLMRTDVYFHAAIVERDDALKVAKDSDKEKITKAARDEIRAIKDSLSTNMFRNEYLKSAWERVSTKVKDGAKKGDDTYRIAEFLDKRLHDKEIGDMYAGLLEADFESFKEPKRSHPWFSNEKAFTGVLHEWLKSYTDLALSEKYRDEQMTPPNLRQVVDQHFKGNFAIPVQVITLDWRNRYLAPNIARLYCDLLSKGKNIRIIIGNDHRDEINDMLTAMWHRTVGRDAPIQSPVVLVETEQERTIRQLREAIKNAPKEK